MATSSGLLWLVAQASTPQAAAAEGDQKAAPGSFFNSLKQAFTQDLGREVVRGHFDVGSPPDAHRFYCLVDPRTGKKEEYAVAGEPFMRSDGMTGLKSGAVAPDSCSAVEAQGRLVTSGYVVRLSARAAAAASAPPDAGAPPSPPSAAASQPVAPTAPPPSAESARAGDALVQKLDVAGIRLGMTPEQVRAALKARSLSNYFEASGSLGTVSAAAGSTDARFLNEIASWGRAGDDAESFEVLFTPVPGRERVMAVIHSVSYAGTAGVPVASLQGGLVRKYTGYATATDLPESPTWRMQADGHMLTGDACNRRSVVGGLAPRDPSLTRDNLALKTTTEEFRFQIQQCGVAIVTADWAVTGSAATQYTVAAYSPSIGLEGATTAAQLIQGTTSASGSNGRKGPGSPIL